MIPYWEERRVKSIERKYIFFGNDKRIPDTCPALPNGVRFSNS
jgi:hypothetical protein